MNRITLQIFYVCPNAKHTSCQTVEAPMRGHSWCLGAGSNVTRSVHLLDISVRFDGSRNITKAFRALLG